MNIQSTSQTIIMPLLTLIMLLYLVIMKPFKAINLIQQISFELILLTVNICLVIFAILNDRDIGVENIGNDSSQVIMISSLIFMFLPSGI